MIYLDYAANTPVDERVLEEFVNLTHSYVANPNAPHTLGKHASEKLNEATKCIAQCLKVKENEIIYTSGATESNNLAIIGAAHYYKRYGKHIITTYLEHSSIASTATALHNEGYEIEFVDILENGKIDLEHLQSLLRKDTILLAISDVDSEIGVRQPISAIKELLTQHAPHCLLHVDATQVVGKMELYMDAIDLMTFTAHKFYGLNGCGALVKKEHVMLEPIIHGGVSTTVFRSGTPTLALIGSMATALKLAMDTMNERYQYVKELNQYIREALKDCKEVSINSPVEASPYLINMSLVGIKASQVQNALANDEIYVATKSACCTLNSPSRPVYALTKDRKKALSTLRVSLSHLTTEAEVQTFIRTFKQILRQIA